MIPGRLRVPAVSGLRYGAILLFALLSLAPTANAHTTAASLNATAGEYTVDVGYDPVTFVAGQYTRFDFLLWRGPAETGDAADFAQVWVRITGGDSDTLLATGIWKQPVGPTTLLYEFVRPGTYKIETSFRDENGNDIAVASFPISVETSSGGADVSTYGPAAGALVAGVVLGILGVVVWRRKT